MTTAPGRQAIPPPDGAGPGMGRQLAAVARRDLRRELRRGEVAWVTIPFGAVAVLAIPLAIGIDAPTLRQVGPGLYWVVVLLFGVLVAVRHTATEQGVAAVGDRLGIDPAAGFLGAATASAVLLIAFEVAVGLVAVALYDIDLGRWPWLLVVVPAVAVGLALLGTMAGSVAAGAGATNLVPFLVVPLALPLLIGATAAVDAGLTQPGGILRWVLMLLLVDVAALVLGVLTARPLQEAG